MLINRFRNGAEKLWIKRIYESGWTENDDHDQVNRFGDWGRRNRFEILEANGRTEVVWARRWFDPTLPKWSDKFPFLSGFSVARSRNDLIDELKKSTGYDGQLLPQAIINMWLNLGLLLKEGDDLILSSETIIQIVAMEEALKSYGGIMAVDQLNSMYDDRTTLSEKDARITVNGVILDLEYLLLNEGWIYSIIADHGNLLKAVDLVDVAPLNLDQFNHLDDSERGEIISAVFEKLASAHPNLQITVTGTEIEIGDPKEVARAFVEYLTKLQTEVTGSLKEAGDAKDELLVLRKELEASIRLHGIGNAGQRATGKLLTIRGRVLEAAERKIDAMLDQI